MLIGGAVMLVVLGVLCGYGADLGLSTAGIAVLGVMMSIIGFSMFMLLGIVVYTASIVRRLQVQKVYDIEQWRTHKINQS
jgi:hypothetical protein